MKDWSGRQKDRTRSIRREFCFNGAQIVPLPKFMPIRRVPLGIAVPPCLCLQGKMQRGGPKWWTLGLGWYFVVNACHSWCEGDSKTKLWSVLVIRQTVGSSYCLLPASLCPSAFLHDRMQADVVQIHGTTRSGSTQSPISLSDCARVGPCMRMCRMNFLLFLPSFWRPQKTFSTHMSLLTQILLMSKDRIKRPNLSWEATYWWLNRDPCTFLSLKKGALHSFQAFGESRSSWYRKFFIFMCVFSSPPIEHTVHEFTHENCLDLVVDCPRTISPRLLWEQDGQCICPGRRHSFCLFDK